MVVKHRSSIALAALLVCAPVLSASSLVRFHVTYPVPAIPHGQDWKIVLPPEPVIPQVRFSLEEVMSIVPQMPPIRHDLTIIEFGSSAREEKQSSLATAGCLIAALILLLAGYDLIPRVHASTLRVRSLDLNQDLFS